MSNSQCSLCMPGIAEHEILLLSSVLYGKLVSTVSGACSEGYFYAISQLLDFAIGRELGFCRLSLHISLVRSITKRSLFASLRRCSIVTVAHASDLRWMRQAQTLHSSELQSKHSQQQWDLQACSSKACRAGSLAAGCALNAHDVHV